MFQCMFRDKGDNNREIKFTPKITVKPAHEVTSIKQSLVLKGHPFLVLSYNIHIN